MPGMGLTAIGLAGLTLSYAEIAHTFIDGMHALTGLTMFIGLIFLAVGILDGGISTSNRAKATTLVILAISLGFGMYAFTLNTSNYTITLAGILMAIAFPAILIAYLAMKHPNLLKPIGSIVGIAGATGVIVWFAFGFVSPDQYMIPQSIEIIEPEIEQGKAAFPIEILTNSETKGNQHYKPNIATVSQGQIVEWTNSDSTQHTVTSSTDFGETFDSTLDAGAVYTLDTTDLAAGQHEYVCIVHPWMTSTLIITKEAHAKVTIPQGAAIPKDGQIYYDPEIINVSAGTTITWENMDSTIHTTTSGTPDTGADEIFDSDIFGEGDTFEHTFTKAGSYDYYCILHAWMVGTVNVE